MSIEDEITLIYNEYGDDLYSYALSLGYDENTSLDAIQDIFYKICLNLDRYKSKHNLKFYLFKVLKNRLFDLSIVSKEIYQPGLSMSGINDDLVFYYEVSVEDMLINEEDGVRLKSIVENMLNSLSDRQREIIYLKYMLECSYEEIADIMQISVISCRNMVHKALKNLKDIVLI